MFYIYIDFQTSRTFEKVLHAQREEFNVSSNDGLKVKEVDFTFLIFYQPIVCFLLLSGATYLLVCESL